MKLSQCIRHNNIIIGQNNFHQISIKFFTMSLMINEIRLYSYTYFHVYRPSHVFQHTKKSSYNFL